MLSSRGTQLERNYPAKNVSMELVVLHFPMAVDHFRRAHCRNCDLPLFLSQPNLTSPERLLGVCEECGRWFVIDLITDQTEGLLWRVPDTEVIRQLFVEDSSE